MVKQKTTAGISSLNTSLDGRTSDEEVEDLMQSESRAGMSEFSTFTKEKEEDLDLRKIYIQNYGV